MRHVPTEVNFTKYSTSQSVPVHQKERLKDCHNPEETKSTWGQMECDRRDGDLPKTKEIWIKYGLQLLWLF